MRRRKSPQQKKAEAYRKARRYHAWSSNNATRRKKPIARALDQRHARRKVREALSSTEGDTTQAHQDAVDTKIKTIRRPGFHYSSVSVSLAAHLSQHRHRRIDRVAFNYFKQPYQSELHKQGFSRFLENVIAGATADSRSIAWLLKEALDLPDSINSAAGRGYIWWRARAQWLRAFLADAPGWEPRLRAWIQRQLRQP